MHCALRAERHPLNSELRAAIYVPISMDGRTRFRRRLTGRVKFSDEERQRIAHELGYPADWLFQVPLPPMPELESSRQERA